MKPEEPKSDLIKVETDIQEFNEIIKDIVENSSVISLKEHLQHMKSTRYEHCYNVAYYTYVICKKMRTGLYLSYKRSNAT